MNSALSVRRICLFTAMLVHDKQLAVQICIGTRLKSWLESQISQLPGRCLKIILAAPGELRLCSPPGINHFLGMEKRARDYLALALDNCPSLVKIKHLVTTTERYFGVIKIGLEQFTRYGPAILDVVRAGNQRIFLDLKLHDIPNTVAQAVMAAADHEVDLLTLHTTGGRAMLRAAVEIASTLIYPPRLIGVTVLTSIDQPTLNYELRVPGSVTDQVANCARMAVDAGLNGIVCSAADLPQVRPLLPAGVEVITPGIRFDGGTAHDQKRVATPHEAISNGATLLVIGRAVTEAPDALDAAARIHQTISEILVMRAREADDGMKD